MSQDLRQDEEVAASRRARILNMTYTDTSRIAQKQLFGYILSPEEIASLRVVPLQAASHAIVFGVTNTTAQQTMTGLRSRFSDQQISFTLISDAGFREYLNLYNPPEKIIYKDIELNSGSDDLISAVSATLEKVRADDMLAYIVQQAHRLKASDIHLESQLQYVRIRFRVDGVLHTVARLSKEKYRILISAIASSGNISTSSQEAQQGHITQSATMANESTVNINLRVETVPAVNGMDIVMRLFSMSQDMYQLDRLGLSERERSVIEEIIYKPSGLVMAVGPTGSGKTTTLYSVLNSLNNEERKIITIEDPVEYQFEGITQISVTSKNSEEKNFAEKLRAVLRLDPDVVMVGEVRDGDTAKTALQASLTGHLVLTTFHAASASAALTRLMDLVGSNPLFISAIRLIMAQRLVRRLDDETKQPYQPDEKTYDVLQSVINSLPDGVDRPDISQIQLYKPGTSPQNPYGFKGQLSLREQLLISDELRLLLQSKAKISTSDIEECAVRNGMLTMLQDGVLKAINGHTTLDEVYRVVG